MRRNPDAYTVHLEWRKKIWHALVSRQHSGTGQCPPSWQSRPCLSKAVHPWTRQCSPSSRSPAHRPGWRRRLLPRCSASQKRSALSHRRKDDIRGAIEALAGWLIPVVTFYKQPSKRFTRSRRVRVSETEKVVPCIGILHIVYLQAAVTHRVHTSIMFILVYRQCGQPPGTIYLLAFIPANVGGSVSQSVILVGNHHWRPSQNTLFPP